MAYRARFELTGETPLLMHWDNIEGCDVLAEWRNDPKNKNQSVRGDDRSPPWGWQTYLYRDGDQVVAIPSDNLMSALSTGGAQLILKKQKTYKELSQSSIFIATEYLEFTYGEGQRLLMSQVEAMKDLPFAQQAAACEKLGIKLFCKRAKVGASKHIRVRPRFERWSLSGSLTVTSPDLPFEKLEAIFDYAGRAGLCDWRPSSPKRPGPYGMFTAKVTPVK